MKTRTVIGLTLRTTVIVGLFIFCLESLQAAGEVGPNYFVIKEVKSNQIGVGATQLATNPYRFLTAVTAASNGSITGGTISLPAGSSAGSPQALSPQSFPTGSYRAGAQFADLASLNSNYGDGTYALQATGASSTVYNASLSLSGGVYPSTTPLIANTTWSGGNLVVDPSASFTLNWSAFTGSTPADRIVLSIDGVAFQALSGSTTSQTFAAGVFQPNQTYQADINFLKVTATDTTDISGSTGFAAYVNATNFNIQTVPEPTTFAMLSLGAALALLYTYKRRAKN